MIAASCFAVLMGDGPAEELKESGVKAAEEGRHHDGVLFGTAEGFEGGGRAGRSGPAIVVLSAGADEGGRSFPVVQGLLGRDVGAGAARFHDGEFVALDRGEAGDLLLERDLLGTRPLYAKDDGRRRGYATDHRFFGSDARDLVPPGSVVSLSAGTVAERRLAPSEPPATFEEAVEALAASLSEATRRRVEGKGRVAVSFSGGLDSSIVALCASRSASVVLCSAFAKGSTDEGAVGRAADLLGLELVTSEVGSEEAAREASAASLPFEPSAMDRALWVIYSRASALARREGAEVILLGQLADELFGGYMKYSLEEGRLGSRAAAEMMESDVRGSASRGFVRDESACSRYLEPRFPFADERLVREALGMPVSYKIRDGERKSVLREAALALGLPEELARSPKKAAQYSSGVLKLLERS